MKSRLYVSKKDYDRIVKSFNESYDNSESAIARRLNIERHIVQHSIDFYLSQKRNYLGAIPEYKITHSKLKDEFWTIINGSKYCSIKTAANALKIPQYKLREAIPKGECSVNVTFPKPMNKYKVKTKSYKIERVLK